MSDVSITQASCCKYELEIEMGASRQRVWKALIDEINDWWLPDFHVVAADSTVTLNPDPGGPGLVERTVGGSALQWYAVQMYLPDQFKIYLVGHIAPDWGGPVTSNLQFALTETANGAEASCLFKLVDARHGNVNQAHLNSYQDGWRMLFTDGLKKYVEA